MRFKRIKGSGPGRPKIDPEKKCINVSFAVLPADIRWINEGLEDGTYRSASEAVRAALKFMRESGK